MGYNEIAFQIEGNKTLKNLINEAGGLRLQRVPPTEKRGRVHTSTVTVSVLNSNVKTDERYNQREEKDFYVEWFSGTGKGGQKRNKSQSCCRLYHLPTGLMESRQGRSRENNMADAKAKLLTTLDKMAVNHGASIQSSTRKKQVGSGMRGDKVRTLRFQDDQVVDHRNNKSTTAKKFMKGNMDSLWD